jgi:hypothetical protein
MIWAAAAMCSATVVAAPTTQAVATPRPAPVFARTVVLAPAGGRTLIELPGAYRRFVTLSASRAVPVGTVVDATAGTVSLTSADPGPAPTKQQTGRFSGGSFRVEQSRTAGGQVDLVIRDSVSRSACTAHAAHAAALSQRVLGLLLGKAKGHFRTVGRFAAATVRGTDWGVRDRCDGTLTVVRTGVVVVRDFRLHENVSVRAGQTYLAKAL